MRFRRSRSRRWPVAAAVLVVTAMLGLLAARSAAPQTIDQTTFVDRKQSARLPNGITLKYVELGDPGGQAVILLHGSTDNSRSWSLMTPYLGGFRLLVPDQRGHGHSDKPECCYNPDIMAYDLKLLMDVRGLERASLVGHSMGSSVAQMFAVRYPDRIDRLVLIGSRPLDAGSSLPDTDEWTVFRQMLAEIEGPLVADPRDEPMGSLLQTEFMQSWYWNPTAVDAEFLEYEMAESVLAIRARTHDLFGRPRTRDIKAPTLILWGDQDPLMGQEQQEALREALPEARFRIFDGLGHNPFWEQPAAVAEVVQAFLEQPGDQ